MKKKLSSYNIDIYQFLSRSEEVEVLGIEGEQMEGCGAIVRFLTD